MKKKILLSMLVILLLTLTGCGSTSDKNEEKKVDKSVVEVNGIKLNINKEKEFKGIKYTITDDLSEANFDQYVQYYLYQDFGPNLLFFRIFYYSKKTNKEIIKALGLDDKIELKNGKTDNIEYKFYEEPREDGGTIHFYFINKNEKTYVLNFMSKYDIKDFEEKVIKSVKF